MSEFVGLRPIPNMDGLWFDATAVAQAFKIDPAQLAEHASPEFFKAPETASSSGFVSEAGLYQLLAMSDPKTRDALDRWVFACMLPQLRSSVAALLNGQAPPSPSAEPPPDALSRLMACLAAPVAGAVVN